MERWIFGVFLAIAAGQDFWKKRVDIWIYMLFGGLALTYRIVSLLGNSITVYHLTTYMGGICLGLVMAGFSVFSHGSIGIGDALFFCVSGILLKFQENVLLFCGGVFCCGLFSLVYLLFLRFRAEEMKNMRKQTVPFLPFLIPTGILLLWVS